PVVCVGPRYRRSRPVRRIVRRFIQGKIRLVLSRPLLLVSVPPYVLFLFRPRLAARVGRGAVVHDASVARPREAPVEMRAGPVRRIRLPRTSVIEIGPRVYARVNPHSAGGRAVVL